VRQAVAQSTLPMSASQHPGRFDWQTGDPGDSEGLVARFTRELEPLGGAVHRVTTAQDAIAWIVDFAARTGARELLTWDEKAIGLPGLTVALQQAGANVADADLPADLAAREARLAQLGECQIGVTGGDYGLADTGSIALVSGPGRGRLASLLAPVHVAVLPASRLVWSLSDALRAAPDLAASGSNFVVITGPSRTADIEMTLTRGVHGPRDVHVVLVG
jgi:L-lactate dehydrogenase complex protein LldG